MGKYGRQRPIVKDTSAENLSAPCTCTSARFASIAPVIVEPPAVAPSSCSPSWRNQLVPWGASSTTPNAIGAQRDQPRLAANVGFSGAFRLTLWSDNQVRVQKEGEVLGPAHGEWMMSPTSNCIVVTFTATGRDLVQSTLVRVGANTYLKNSSSWDYQFVAVREGPTMASNCIVVTFSDA